MKNLFQNKLPQATPTHATLLAVIGGYFVWMSYKMYQNTKQGISTMSMQTTIILMVVMDLMALLVFIYAGYVFWQSWKQASGAHEEALQKQEDTAAESAEEPDEAEEPEEPEEPEDPAETDDEGEQTE